MDNFSSRLFESRDSIYSACVCIYMYIYVYRNILVVGSGFQKAYPSRRLMTNSLHRKSIGIYIQSFRVARPNKSEMSLYPWRKLGTT